MPPFVLPRRGFLRQSALGLGAAAGVISRGWAVPRQHAHSTSRPAGADSLVAFRIGCDQWLTDERFEALLQFFRQSPGTADELAFFTAGTHPPLPLAELERRAERLSRLLPQVRRESMAAGINLLGTMGHHEENLEGSLATDWQRVVDPRGNESKGSFCPAGGPFREFVVRVYTALAQAKPDFLWIDDDVRLAGHMPIGFTCFCADCLRRFADECGRSYTREGLVAAFGTGPREERLELRRRWLRHNRTTLDALFALIEKTVHQVAPDLPLGFMTGDRFYEGYDFANWAGTLAGPRHLPVRWRPGGGFYSDETLAGLVGKAHDLGRQVAQLPASVTVIQSEIENFPYDKLRKSVRTTVVEAAAHLGAGTTGTAFNVLSQRPDPLEEYLPMLRAIARAKPFYRRLRDTLGRHPLSGVWPAWNRDLFAVNNLEGSWPDGPGEAVAGLNRAYVLGELGVPICYSPESASVIALSGPGLLAFSREELRGFFSRGVLMDVTAWQALDRLGLAGWTGVRPGEGRVRDTLERLTSHELNGRFASWSRDCRQSFWRETVHPLEPSAPGVSSLAELIDYQDRTWGSAMTAYTNELGGRVVVMGYYPWSQIHHLAKSSQIKAVCQWLGRGQLPVQVESFARVQVWARTIDSERFAAVLLNASLDPTDELTLRLARPFRRYHFTSFDGSPRRVSSTVNSPEGGVRLVLPEIGPWSLGLLTAAG